MAKVWLVKGTAETETSEINLSATFKTREEAEKFTDFLWNVEPMLLDAWYCKEIEEN